MRRRIIELVALTLLCGCDRQQPARKDHVAPVRTLARPAAAAPYVGSTHASAKQNTQSTAINVLAELTAYEQDLQSAILPDVRGMTITEAVRAVEDTSKWSVRRQIALLLDVQENCTNYAAGVLLISNLFERLRSDNKVQPKYAFQTGMCWLQFCLNHDRPNDALHVAEIVKEVPVDPPWLGWWHERVTVAWNMLGNHTEFERAALESLQYADVHDLADMKMLSLRWAVDALGGNGKYSEALVLIDRHKDVAGSIDAGTLECLRKQQYPKVRYKSGTININDTL